MLRQHTYQPANQPTCSPACLKPRLPAYIQYIINFRCRVLIFASEQEVRGVNVISISERSEARWSINLPCSGFVFVCSSASGLWLLRGNKLVTGNVPEEVFVAVTLYIRRSLTADYNVPRVFPGSPRGSININTNGSSSGN